MKKRMILLCVAGMVMLAGGCGSADAQQPGQDSGQVSAQQPAENTLQEAKPQDTPQEDTSTADQSNQTEPKQEETAGDSQGQPSQEEPSADTQGQPQTADMEGLNEVIESVYNAVPGTAGSSLKSVLAAGRLLDWAEENGTAASAEHIADAVSSWRTNAMQSQDSVYTDADMLEALAAVDANAQQILTDRTQIADLLEDSGCVLGHDQYSEDSYRNVYDAILSNFQ